MSSETNGELVAPISINRDSNNPPKPPVWALESANPGVPLPLHAKCGRHGRQGDICCKDLKDDDDRTLVDPDIVRDVVIGLSDGLTVPFALTAGLSSLGESRLVVLGGIAELIAGAISMGVGGFLASQAERDHYGFLKRHISCRVQRSCDGEMEREVYAILGPVGVDVPTAQAVTKSLQAAECEGTEGPADEERQQLRWKDDVGLTAFLLKFGEGLKEVPTRRLYLSAMTIGLGYLVGGIVPLIPYFFISRAHVALLYSCILTGVVLLVFGAIKARVTGAGNDVAGYIWGAVSTLMVGGAAAAAAYGMVALFERDP
ncbi:VIT family-domain-containing protein [Pisolithus orientalis]|uniref:VIT family-domain-containing protein n=1 Tax=Pisolithus orientalis TaxID=936130 RepID=UPI0022256916|nr:VIT family-domain-containing protein [Pisolithus orientalis]KAI6033108.1 VIT family-domain-containing protein [Pisolithus orientalis]